MIASTDTHRGSVATSIAPVRAGNSAQARGDGRQAGDVDAVARRIIDQRQRVGALAQLDQRPQQGRSGAAAAMRDDRLRRCFQYLGKGVDISARQGRGG